MENMTRLYKNIINRLGIWRSIQAVMIIISSVLLISVIFQVFIPIQSGQIDSLQYASRFVPNESISELLNENVDKTKEPIAYRSGMFKPATGLQDKPLANKTIERIKEQLKLQCIMEMNGTPVAYINIQGIGLKKCCLGDNINDLFTVLGINKQNKSVDISIVEHKVTLHL